MDADSLSGFVEGQLINKKVTTPNEDVWTYSGTVVTSFGWFTRDQSTSY